MSYSSFELASGDALREVQHLCRHAARAGGAFSSSTVPTLASVEQYLTTSYHWIRSRLAKGGLSDTQTLTAVLGVLQQLQVYDVAMKVELALPTEAAGGGASERWTLFRELRDELATMISDGSLAAIGATERTDDKHRTPFVGGISKSRKDVMEDDTDINQHRIKRDQFRYQYTIPSGRTAVTVAEE